MKYANSEQRGRYAVILLVVTFFAANTDTSADSAIQPNSLRIAVATNFTPVLKVIATEFTKATRIGISVISGSTGKLYAQIRSGMDVDVFLAADQTRIHRLVEDGMTLDDTLTTYAEGKLVWWQPDSLPIFNTENMLQISSDVSVVAFAQPEIAPYGMAAEQALSKCFQFEHSRIRFVYGENAGHTYAHVATGNADAGLVALASIKISEIAAEDSYTIVPDSCHQPIRQDAVALKASRSADTARQFLNYLRDERAQQLIAAYGYTLP